MKRLCNSKKYGKIILIFAIIIAAHPGIFAQGLFTLDFEQWSGETILSGNPELKEMGITFDQGAKVVDCTSLFQCGGDDLAFSGSNALVPINETEFHNKLLEVTFSKVQSEVSLKIKIEGGSPSNDYLLEMEGYEETEILGSPALLLAEEDTRTVPGESGFVELSLTGGNIKKVYVKSKWVDADSYSNFFIVDDITFDSTQVDVPEDTEPPTLGVNVSMGDYYTRPPSSGLEVTDKKGIKLNAYVTDNDQLQEVKANLYSNSTGDTIGAAVFCGTSPICPLTSPTSFSQEATIGYYTLDFPNGEYTLTTHACDISGNCTKDSFKVIMDIPPPPETIEPHVLKVEVNQGMQYRLFDVDGPGTARDATSYVPLMPEKNTLVRFYVAGIGGTRSGYSGKLNLVTWNDEGSVIGRYNIQPNLKDMATVDLPALPEDEFSKNQLLLGMRASMPQTLNFVIPGDYLKDADLIQLKLQEGTSSVTGGLQIDMVTPTRLGINFIKMDSTDRSLFTDRIVPYLKSSLPVSEVRVLSNWFSFTGVNIKKGDDDNSCRLKSKLKNAFGGGDTPFKLLSSDPSWTATIGVVDGIRGCAFIGNPDNDGDRHENTAVIRLSGNNATHEIGHLLGLRHSGNSHDEKGADKSYPYPHGSRPNDGLQSDFGMDIRYDSATEKWNVFPKDPCPVSDLSLRNPCQANDTGSVPFMGHDIMSYGPNRWPSHYNYQRMYFAIAADGSSTARMQNMLAGKKSDNPREEGLIISGQLSYEDQVSMFPVMRKAVKPSYFSSENGGYTLEILDSLDNMLFTKTFAMDEVGDSDCCSAFFNEYVPYYKNMAKIRIKEDGQIKAEMIGKDTPPQIKLTSPEGGQYYGQELKVTWENQIENSGPMDYLIQYSPDLGKSWTGLGYLSDTIASEITVDVKDYPPSDSAIIRINASDGFNTSVDYTKQSFCINTQNTTCRAKDVNQPFIVTGLSKDRAQEPDISVNPVPFNNKLFVNINTQKATGLNIKIINTVGKTIYTTSETLIQPGSHIREIMTGHLQPGIYIITVKLDEKIFRKKIVKN